MSLFCIFAISRRIKIVVSIAHNSHTCMRWYAYIIFVLYSHENVSRWYVLFFNNIGNAIFLIWFKSATSNFGIKYNVMRNNSIQLFLNISMEIGQIQILRKIGFYHFSTLTHILCNPQMQQKLFIEILFNKILKIDFAKILLLKFFCCRIALHQRYQIISIV